jgi:hypothetical protein
MKLKTSRKILRWTPEDEPADQIMPGGLLKLKSKLYVLDPIDDSGLPGLTATNARIHSSTIKKNTLAVYMGHQRTAMALRGKRTLSSISHIIMIGGRLFTVHRLRDIEVVPVDAPDRSDPMIQE